MTNDFKSSDHLKDYKFLTVEILTTPGNCTSYIIKQTQGAEFGGEAERVRECFQKAINKEFGLNVKQVEADCNDCDWQGQKSEMDEDEDGETMLCPLCNSDNIYYHS